MVFINEWLPIPAGADAKAQFIELYNSGVAPVGLSGWVIAKSGGATANNAKTSGKTFWLDGHRIPAGGYLVLSRAETKLALKHTNENLALFDARGRLVDRSSFTGAARKGKSFSRVDDGIGPQQHFAWASPTPGAVNGDAAGRLASDAAASANQYPVGVPLNQYAPGAVQLLGLLLAAALILSALVVYCVKHEERISKHLFAVGGGDGAAR